MPSLIWMLSHPQDSVWCQHHRDFLSHTPLSLGWVQQIRPVKSQHRSSICMVNELIVILHVTLCISSICFLFAGLTSPHSTDVSYLSIKDSVHVNQLGVNILRTATTNINFPTNDIIVHVETAGTHSTSCLWSFHVLNQLNEKTEYIYHQNVNHFITVVIPVNTDIDPAYLGYRNIQIQLSRYDCPCQ